MTLTATQSHSLSLPALLLRLEGLVVLFGSIALYANQGGGWLTFVVLLLAPDLSMVGYLANTRVGALTYNTAHTYMLPALLAALSLAAGLPLLMQLALIWFAHIGMDRAVGYGFKYPTDFKDTHLARV